jgi:Rrf2 family nitric oxide-sensitive transcriptional repressor
MHMIKIKNRGTKVHIFCSYDRSRVGTQAVRLTKFTDYSLRLLMYLAASPERRATIAEVAKAYGISEHHVVKVVHLLGKEGYLRNTRGKGGGVQLARPACEINVGRVVRATEGADHLAECFDPEDNDCVLTEACRLRRAFQEAVDSFYASLERHTLEDLRIRAPKLVAALRWHARPPS